MLNNLKKYKENLINFVKRKPTVLFANVLITELCTQRCLQCSIPSRDSKIKNMSLEHFSLIMKKLSDFGTQFITISGGEPMLHPELELILEEAEKYEFKKV